jgi:hypothetical protein
MARRKKFNDEISKNSGGVGYSQAALDKLNAGTYGRDIGSKRQIQYRTSQEQTQQSRQLPVLEGLTRSNDWESSNKVDTVGARQRYAEKNNYKPIGRSLSNEDEKLLYKTFDRNRLSSGGNAAIVHQLKNNIWNNTRDWEEKYGKTIEQIVEDYSKDYEKIAEKRNTEKGKNNKVLTTLTNTLRGGTVEPALDTMSTLAGKVAPNSPLTRAYRDAAEKYSKQKKQTVEGVTGNMSGVGKQAYELGTGLGERALQYANPSALKYVLTAGKTAENTRQSLKERGIEGTNAEIQSGLAGLVDAGLDIVGLESVPALKGLVDSGNIGKEVLGRMAIGGGEQALTEFINRMIDRSNGEKSLHNVAVQNYMSQGMSAEDAEKQANIDDVLGVAQASVSGGLLNNIMGFGGRMLGNVPSLFKRSDIARADVPETESTQPDVIKAAQAQQAQAMDNINRLSEQIPDNSDRLSVEEMRALGLDDETINRQLEIYNNSQAQPNRIGMNETASEVIEQPEISNTPKEYKINTVNLKGGKKGYYVSESVDGTTTRNIEPGKVYKTEKEAQAALDNIRNKTMAESAPKNPTLTQEVRGLAGDDLKVAQDRVSSNKAQIKALENEIKVIESDPNNKYRGNLKKSAKADIESRKAQIAELKQDNKVTTRQIKGEPTPVIEQLDADSVTRINDFKKEVRKIGNMWGGESGKQLAKDVNDALDRYIETGSREDLHDLRDKLYTLHNSATGEYTSKNGNVSRYSDYYGDRELGIYENLVSGNSLLRKALREADNLRNAKQTTPDVETANNVPPTNPPMQSDGGEPPITPIELTQDANGDVVESGTSQHIRSQEDVTIATPMKYNVADEVAADFLKDPQMYKQLKNADTDALAESIYRSGDTPVSINGRTYQGNAEAKFRQLLSEKNPASLPLGKRVADEYSAHGNHDMAAQVYRDMGEALTEAGQFTQASIIAMTKDDPLTALAYLEKELDTLNKTGAEKYGKKWNDFVLTDAEKQRFENIKSGDSDAIREAYDEIGARIEKEYPASAWEKVLEFRRVAMLLNSRTIIRNTIANPPTALLRYVADRIEGVGQYVTHLIKPDFEVTQSIRGASPKLWKQANKIFDSDKVQNMLKSVPGKNSEVPKVGDYAKSKQMFKGWFVSDFINKLTGNGIEKLNAKLGKKGAKSVMELARNTAYSALEITDNPFVRENFNSRLGSYMRAKGITDANNVPDEAINIALEEALKATYKDNSWLVQGIRSAKGAIENIGNGIMPGVRLGDMASQALIPYVQAPGNIGARIVDYSPVGATKGIVDIIRGANKGDNKLLAKGIETFSKGATGSMMAALGMALYRSGILTGTYSTDKDQKAFEKKNGFREFAIKYNWNGQTKYDTIDWAQPFVDTLMPGVLFAQAIENSEKYDSDILRYFGVEGSALGKGIGIATDTIGKNINYFFDATPLKNLGELLSSKANGETDIAGNLWQNTVEDFASALFPASVNALAKSVDPIQRQTYNPDNSFGTFLNTNMAKVPELTKKLPIKYDTWGQPMTYGASKGEAAIAKMLYPGEHTSDKSDAVDNEINRLFDETQNKGVFPQVAPYSVDGAKLTDKEYSEYQKTMGRRNRQMAETLINSAAYQNIDDKTRAELINDMFNASKAIADYEIKGKEYSNTYKKAGEAYKEGGAEAVVNHYLGKNLVSDAGLSPSSNAAKDAMAAVSSGDIKKAQEIIQKDTTEKDGASNAGFIDKDGKPNVDAYNKAVSIVGNDVPKLNAYKQIKDYTTNAELLPALMNNNAFNDDEKGQIVMAQHGYKYDDLGATAKGAYDREGAVGVYYFYLLKNLADTDGNGSVKKAEKEALLNSDNPYVTQLSDDMYYYLAGAKW